MDKSDIQRESQLGDFHVGTSLDTPISENAFDKSDEEKVEIIADHFKQIMETLGLDLTDDSLSGTPLRVAKMYVEEVFSGLNPDLKPSAKLFENKFNYKQMLLEKDIRVHSFCEHHFVPIMGVAHVAYISSGEVIGLSKINRIVDYFSRRPQVQERLTNQIGEELKRAMNTEDVAVVIEAKHMCVSLRGIKDDGSSTSTSFFGGAFEKDEKRQEFFRMISLK